MQFGGNAWQLNTIFPFWRYVEQLLSPLQLPLWPWRFVFHCSTSHRAYLTCEIIFKQHRLCLFTQSEKRGEEITSSVEQSHPQEIGPEEEIENDDGDVEVVLSLVQPSAELDMEEEKEKADVDGLTPTVLILSGCKTPQFLSNFYQFKDNTHSSKWSPEGGRGGICHFYQILVWNYSLALDSWETSGSRKNVKQNMLAQCICCPFIR